MNLVVAILDKRKIFSEDNKIAERCTVIIHTLNDENDKFLNRCAHISIARVNMSGCQYYHNDVFHVFNNHANCSFHETTNPENCSREI